MCGRSTKEAESSRKKNDTWLYFQRAAVDLDVQPLGRRTAEVLQHTLDGFRHVIGDRLVQLHPAVHHNAAVPEVENLQLLESSQVGLQVGQELWSTRGGGKASQTPVPPCRPPALTETGLGVHSCLVSDGRWNYAQGSKGREVWQDFHSDDWVNDRKRGVTCK